MTLVDTGEETHDRRTAEARARRYLDDDDFCFTYGDGVSDIDIQKLIAFHRDAGRLATVTAVQPPGRFGALEVDGERVRGFHEKPHGDGGWINGGFFVLSPKVVDYIDGRPDRLGARADGALAARGPARRLRARRVLAARWTPSATRTTSRISGRRTPRRGRRGDRSAVKARSGAGAAVLVTGHTGFKGSWLACGSRAWAPT